MRKCHNSRIAIFYRLWTKEPLTNPVLVFYAIYEFVDVSYYDWLWKIFHKKCTGKH